MCFACRPEPDGLGAGETTSVENEETKLIGDMIVHENELKCSKRNRAVESMSIRRSLLYHLDIASIDYDREEEATVIFILLWDIPVKLDVLRDLW